MTCAANTHASVVAFGPRGGVLILGPSGAGKSRLSLALIDAGAQLVADDQVFLSTLSGRLFARTPRSIAGLIEARGLGILRLAHRRLAQVAAVVDLGVASASTPGPRPASPETCVYGGVTIPCLRGTPDTPFARAIAHYITTLIKAE